jgi:arsenite/tail-anchored protein-transporting ATPase
LPDDLLQSSGVPPYLAQRAAMQGRHLDRIRHDLGDQVLGYVPELERDITGLPMIERMAHLLYGPVPG